ncbi:MAG: hypothetical protein MK085_10115 [Phycisphaerales bacterium]|nr:hypothetical protein [Phycisphaerales bacterium]
MMRPVLVIGEILASPDGPKGTGADIARELAASDGGPVVLASRVGDGEIGRELVAELEAAGIDCSIIQYDYDRPTMRSRTTRTDSTRVSAHEMLQWDSDLERIALIASMVVCTIGIRHSGQARSTADRALLAAEGVPRALVLVQDTPNLGAIDHTVIGRATELCEVVLAGEEGFDALRVRNPDEDAPRVVAREDLAGLVLAQQDSLTTCDGGPVHTRSTNIPPIQSVIEVLRTIAGGTSIKEAMHSSS